MKNFQRVQVEALGSHGVLTYKTMHQMGILSPEIARWTHQGWLLKVGHGVYRLSTYPSQGIVSDMAAILAEVGEESYLYGESVLGQMLPDGCVVKGGTSMRLRFGPGRSRVTLPHCVVGTAFRRRPRLAMERQPYQRRMFCNCLDKQV